MPAIFGCASKKDAERIKENELRELAENMLNFLKFKKWHIGEYSLIEGNEEYSAFLREVGLDTLDNSSITDKEECLVVAAGRIFNKKEVGEKFGMCNEDVNLVSLYLHTGTEFVKHLNGHFAFAILDKVKRKLILANDRFSSNPIFYSLTPSQLLFASEMGAVLICAQHRPEINREAVLEYFTFHFTLGDKTLFSNVKRLSPSSIMSYDLQNGKFSVEKYWDIDLRGKSHGQAQAHVEPLEPLYEEFKKIMRKAVERRMFDQEKIGVFLSGGVDSRILAGFASEIAKATGKEVITFSTGVKGGIQQRIAKKVADMLGIENISYETPSDIMERYSEEIVRHACGIMGIIDAHNIAILEDVKKRVDVILLGTFGGELFGAMLPKVDDVESVVKKYTIVKKEHLNQVFSESFLEEIWKASQQKI